MNAKQLVEFAKAALGSAYLWGTFGQTVTETLIQSKRKQYPSVYTDAYIAKCRKRFGQKAYDCVGLIKAALWGGKYDTATDIGADTAYNTAKVKGVIGTLPEIPGVCLWNKGHIGVYIGDGYAIEARGVDYGVVKTRVKDRSWTHWLEYPGVVYATAINKSPIEITVDNALADGAITDGAYWRGVLDGTITPKPEYIKKVIDTYHGMMAR